MTNKIKNIKKNINQETFLDYQFLSDPKISPSGNIIAFTVNTPDVDDNNYKTSLYICKKLKDNKIIKLISKSSVRNYQWIDDDTIMFASTRCPKVREKLSLGEELTQYYTISVNGGEAQKYFNIELLASDIKPLKTNNINNNLFLVTAKFDNNRPDLEGLSKPERLEVLKEYKEKGYTVFEETPFWFNDIGMTNRKRNRLYIYDDITKEVTAITKPFFNVANVKLKDNYVLYQGYEFESFGTVKNGVYLYNLTTKETSVIIEPNKFKIKFMDLYINNNNNKIIISYVTSEGFGLNQNGNIYLIDIDTKKESLLTNHEHQNIAGNTTGTDARFGGGIVSKVEEDTLYYITTKVNHSYINSLNLKTGDIKELTSEGAVDAFDIYNNSIYMIAFKDNNLGELYSLENNINNKQETKISKFNDFVLEEYSISEPEEVISKNMENIENFDVHGYVLKPAGYVKGNSYPAILHIHGGPRTVFSSIYHNEMQLWANNGYFVMYCNPRGSDGRGNEFGDLNARYGQDDYDDLMRFTDKVLELYEDIDKDRVGVTGGSYGGFMTNWIIGHTDRFLCACSQRCISNWTTFEGTTDIGYFFAKDQTGASHMENQELQWEQSPLKYANQVKTPTLFIHSDEDYRCWLVEALQMFTALKMHGVESKLCVFKGENHELSRSGRPRNRIKRMEEILTWFDSYLKK